MPNFYGRMRPPPRYFWLFWKEIVREKYICKARAFVVALRFFTLAHACILLSCLVFMYGAAVRLVRT